MTAKIFIDGAAGTTGLEIHERLGGRGDLRVVTLDDASRKDAGARKDALNDADVVILCLPDDAAREAVTAADARHWQARAALLETRVWIEAAPLLADLLEARTIAFRSPTLPDSAMLARRASTALREASEAAAV